MKYLGLVLFSVLLCAACVFAQTKVENKPNEPVSLSELAKQPLCGSRHLARLNDAIKELPQNTDLYLQRAYCLSQTKNPAFLKDILTVTDLNPKLDNNLFTYLKSLVLGKQPEESQANLKYLIAVPPNHWFHYAIRAELKTEQKDYRGALDDWLRAIESTPLISSHQLWKSAYAVIEFANDKQLSAFYDRIFNAVQKRQRELSVKLKELPFYSKEYIAIRRDVEQIGWRMRGICTLWIERVVKLGNTQMESRVLEKMVAIQPFWQSYQLRSRYYKRAKNDQKAFADEVRSVQLQIEEFQGEIKQTQNQAQRSSLNSRISELYSGLGDLYFRNEQFVKAISQYEKAKLFYPYQNYLESRINAALKKLNVPEQKPEHLLKPDPGLRP